MKKLFKTPKSLQKADTEDLIHELQNRGYIRMLWHKDDIQERYKENFGKVIPLNEDELNEIASYIEHKHDCNNGVNWDFIDFVTQEVLTGEKEPNWNEVGTSTPQ